MHQHFEGIHARLLLQRSTHHAQSITCIIVTQDSCILRLRMMDLVTSSGRTRKPRGRLWMGFAAVRPWGGPRQDSLLYDVIDVDHSMSVIEVKLLLQSHAPLDNRKECRESGGSAACQHKRIRGDSARPSWF